jgi:hypothetical protein
MSWLGTGTKCGGVFIKTLYMYDAKSRELSSCLPWIKVVMHFAMRQAQKSGGVFI